MEFHITDISYLISSSAQCTHVLTCCWRVLASSEQSVKTTPNFLRWKTEGCAVGWFIITMLRETALSRSQIGCKSMGWVKCCTVPCQRISFFNGQTKLGKEYINSQMYCFINQTKSFSMSKCIDPWVDEVACSIKNLVSSLNRLFDVLIKICLYLSFSVTLSFLQVHTLLLPTSNIFRFQCQY